MIALSSCMVGADSGIQRDCPRPPELRQPGFADAYDWDTLFYDVYRADRHIVMQGPPLFNFLGHLRRTPPLRGKFGFPRFAARHFGTDKRGEIWLKSDADHIALDCALGQFAIKVQPDMVNMFVGRRVITTISKNNELRWLADWAAFYAHNHGAEGVLLYDNGSSIYRPADVQDYLQSVLPQLVIVVIDWPFPFGPQGGMAGAVDGVETPWDSDFAQIGSLQHARHRFLRRARSVLNVDIDELVLPASGQSIFAATEAARSGMIRCAGRWIGTAAAPGVTRENCRHADFERLLPPPDNQCPPKWCIVPGRGDRIKDGWSIHNVFGARGNKATSEDFSFRHLRGITTSWKEARWQMSDGVSGERMERDAALADAYARAGLERSIAP